MKSQEVYIALLDKCNKLSSNSNNSIETHVAVRAINEAQYYWYDERLKLAEKNLTIQREISKFIIPKKLEVIDKTDIYYLYNLPEDYYHMNQLRVIGSKNKCQHLLDTYLVENNNSIEYYLNDMYAPDFEWQQTLATLYNNKLKVFIKDFKIDTTLDYYRNLKTFDIESGYKHIDGTLSINSDLEFDNSDAFEIINIAASLITGNLSDPQYQVHITNSKRFE